MKTKRILALLLSFVLCVSFAACGESEAPASSGEPQKVSAPSVQTSDSNQTAPTPTETPEEEDPEQESDSEYFGQYKENVFHGVELTKEQYENIMSVLGPTFEDFEKNYNHYYSWSEANNVILDVERNGHLFGILFPFPTPTFLLEQAGIPVGLNGGDQQGIIPAHSIDASGLFYAPVGTNLYLWNSTDEDLTPNDPGVWVVGYEEYPLELPPLFGKTEDDVHGTFSLPYNPHYNKEGLVDNWDYASIFGEYKYFVEAFGEPVLDEYGMYRYDFGDRSLGLRRAEQDSNRLTMVSLTYEPAFRDAGLM